MCDLEDTENKSEISEGLCKMKDNNEENNKTQVLVCEYTMHCIKGIESDKLIMCDNCNATYKHASSFYRHRKTCAHIGNDKVNENTKNCNLLNMKARHINKTDNINGFNYVCELCDAIYKHCSSYYRHKKICNGNRNNKSKIKWFGIKEEDNDVIQLKEQYKKEINNIKLNSLKKENKMLKKQMEIINTNNEFNKKLSENTAKIADKSMSVISIITQNLINTPILKTLTDEEIKKSLDYTGECNIMLVENLANSVKNKNIIKLLGNALLKHFKKDNPLEQSIWNSDIRRLTYIIRMTVMDEDNWIVDKQGIKTNKIVIEPFLSYLKQITHEVILSEAHKEKIKGNILEFYKNAFEFMNLIETNVLRDEISRYLAPYFAFEKREYVQQIKLLN